MSTPIEAATLRVACAIASQTDLVRVTNVDRADCTFQLRPPDALIEPRTFADHQLDDLQMCAVKTRIADCCPEPSVRNAVLNWPDLPASIPIIQVIDLVEALLSNADDWNGISIPAGYCR